MLLEWLSLHPDAFGLDISDLTLKIAKLKKTKRGLKLISFGSYPIPPGLIKQGEILKEKELTLILKQALKSIQGKELGTKYIVASLPEEKAFLQVIQLPRLKPEEVKTAVIFEAEKYIPLPLEKIYIDTQIVEPLKDHLDHTDVLLASLPRNIVDSYVSLFQNTGFIPMALEIESLAISRALVQNFNSPLPILILDLGATRTGLTIFSGTSIRFTASLGISSQNFTQAISQVLGVDLKKGEELKKQYGIKEKETNQGKLIFEALLPSLSELVDQIKKYMDFYETHASHQHLPKQERKISKIILSGGGANLKGLQEFLSVRLRTEVVRGNPWVNIFPYPLKELPSIPLEEALQYTTALGLALRAIQTEHWL